MKKNIYKFIYGICISLSSFVISSCSDFTDIQPKGKNLLTTADELEMLLNTEFKMGTSDFQTLSGDMIYFFSDVPTEIHRPNKTRDAILLSFDSNNMDKLAELTTSDLDYTSCYRIIGTVANPILSHIGEAQGSDAVKKQLKCEALTLRAYFHYLIVNKFAKAYNPSTAETDGGIPYLMDDWDVSQPTKQLTVKEVYSNIISDLDEAISLDGMPLEAINRMRMSKPCAYAAKALALMSMQKYDEAEACAKQALNLNAVVDDYNNMITGITAGYITGGSYPTLIRPRLECKEDLFYTHNTQFYKAMNPASWNFFEEGHLSRDKMPTDRMMYDYFGGMAMDYIGIDWTYTMDLTSGWNYMGMKTSQMYLIIAEAEINKGNFDNAMEALDNIRVNRIATSLYAPLKGTVDNKKDAIYHLKQTAHGECIYSCYNFINRKRWNQEEGYQQEIVNDYNGEIYTLTPESPLWIFPFPQNAMSNNPNLKQNYK